MPQDFTDRFRRSLTEGKSVEDALVELRAAGASVCESILAVSKVQGCRLSEAKKTVHFSSAWADRREYHERFHDELEKALHEIDDVDA